MYPHIEYDSHPNYAGLENKRLQGLAERNFFPNFAAKQAEYLKLARLLNRPNSDGYIGGKPRWNGVSLVEFSKQDFETLKQTSESIYDELTRRCEANDAASFTRNSIRVVAKNPEHNSFAHAIKTAMRSSGVFEMFHDYTGTKWVIEKAIAQMNSEQSANKILNNSLVDGGSVTPLPYLHIDEKLFRLKALVYMTDVLDEDHGPFRYVKKSQTQLEPLDFIIRKSVDATGIDGQQLKARMVFYNPSKILPQTGEFWKRSPH